MENQNKSCCKIQKQDKGVISGIIYGILPHSFCLLLIIFSLVGAVTATSLLKEFLSVSYFIPLIIGASLLLATTSSVIYLKKNDSLCLPGIKTKWKYLTILYTTTMIVNILMLFVAVPALANLSAKEMVKDQLISCH